MNARSGEIVGLDGAGRTELMKAIAGATSPSAGVIRVGGLPSRLGRIGEARRPSIVYAPEDRKAEGLILDASIRDDPPHLAKAAEIGGSVTAVALPLQEEGSKRWIG